MLSHLARVGKRGLCNEPGHLSGFAQLHRDGASHRAAIHNDLIGRDVHSVLNEGICCSGRSVYGAFRGFSPALSVAGVVKGKKRLADPCKEFVVFPKTGDVMAIAVEKDRDRGRAVMNEGSIEIEAEFATESNSFVSYRVEAAVILSGGLED